MRQGTFNEPLSHKIVVLQEGPKPGIVTPIATAEFALGKALSTWQVTIESDGSSSRSAYCNSNRLGNAMSSPSILATIGSAGMKSQHQGGNKTRIFTGMQKNQTVVLGKAVFSYLSCTVGGSIVDQNQLKVAKCLSLKTLQSFRKQGSAIAYGEQDRNFWDGAGVHEQYLVYLAYGRQSSHALDL